MNSGFVAFFVRFSHCCFNSKSFRPSFSKTIFSAICENKFSVLKFVVLKKFADSIKGERYTFGVKHIIADRIVVVKTLVDNFFV